MFQITLDICCPRKSNTPPMASPIPEKISPNQSKIGHHLRIFQTEQTAFAVNSVIVLLILKFRIICTKDDFHDNSSAKTESGEKFIAAFKRIEFINAIKIFFKELFVLRCSIDFSVLAHFFQSVQIIHTALFDALCCHFSIGFFDNTYLSISPPLSHLRFQIQQTILRS